MKKKYKEFNESLNTLFKNLETTAEYGNVVLNKEKFIEILESIFLKRIVSPSFSIFIIPNISFTGDKIMLFNL